MALKLSQPYVSPAKITETLEVARGEMVQKDYLLRQIEKMGVILAGIRERCFAGEPVQALNQLRDFAAREGVELTLLERLAPDGLVGILGADNLTKLLPAAEVFLLKAEIEKRLGEDETSAASFEKAAVVTGRLQELIGPGAEPELAERLDDLVARVDDYRPGHSSDGRMPGDL